MEAHSNDSLPTALYSAAQTRELDRRAIADGLPGYTLMCRAGAAAFSLLRLYWPRLRRIGVICGSGNNGGDAYVLAHLARQASIEVVLLEMQDPGKLRGEARQAREEWVAGGGQGQTWEGRLPTVELWVDGLLGTGLDRPLAGKWAALVQAVNNSATPVLALDIPSGLNADTGAIPGAAIQATRTLSFIGMNPGLFMAQGPDCCGHLHYAGLGVPPAIYQSLAPMMTRLGKQSLAGLLPAVPRESHKGSFGRVLVLGGAPGMAGAVVLAGLAACRAGAGLVTLVTHPAHAAALDAAWPSLMVRGMSGQDGGELRALAATMDVVLLGPGLERDDWARGLVAAALEAAPRLVVDAGGLVWLGRGGLNQPAVITPHPGEAAALLGCDIPAIQSDRADAVRRLAQRFNAVAVLKGQGTLVGDAANPVTLNAFGGPALATAGTGDVLAGLVAGLMAQGLAPLNAARLGAGLHGLAADAIARRQGERGMLAEDLLPELPRVRQALASAFPVKQY